MEHQIVRVTDFKIVGAYTIQIVFEDKTEQTIDFKPTLQGYYFTPLMDLNLFNGVRLDPEIHTLVWPNDAAYDPATLYNWHKGDGTELETRGTLRDQQTVTASHI